MGGTLATGASIYMESAGVPAADGAGLSSIKSFSQLLTSIAAMPLAGGTFIGHVLFTDNTYDIGASGATRPRTVYAGTSVITPLLNNTNASALTLGNSTYGVTVPGKLSIGRSPSGSTTALDVYNASAAVQATIQSGNNFCELLLTSGNSGIPNYITSNGNLSFYIGGSERLLINQSTGAATFSSTVTATGHRITSGGYGWSWRASASSGYAAIYDETNAREAIKLAPTGTITILNNLIVNGGTYGGAEAGVVLQQSGVNKWQLYDAAGSFRIYNYGTAADAMTIAAATSNATFAGGITASGIVSHGAYTVATLPAAGSNAGKMAQVTDSNVAASGNYGATVAAGGANRVKVFSDGTNWVIA